MKNFYELKFYPNPLNESFVLPSRSESIIGQNDDADWYGGIYQGEELHSILNTKILEWCHRKLPVQSVWVFINDTDNESQYIHIDGLDPKGTYFAINWCLQGTNSEMAWYNIKPQYSFDEAVVNPVVSKTKYSIGFDKNKLNLVEKCRISGPTLVNTAVPHGILRHEPGPRIAVSLRFTHSFSSWNEVVQFFSPFIKK